MEEFAKTSVLRETIPAYGAKMEKKRPNTLQVAVQNSNGFRAFSMAEGAECEDVMRDLELDMYGLSETNRNWDEKSKYILAQIIQRDGPGAAIAASDYSEKEGYLPGGTALLMKGNQCGRVSRQFPDKMGQICYMLLNGKVDTVITFLVLYRVCQKGALLPPQTPPI